MPTSERLPMFGQRLCPFSLEPPRSAMDVLPGGNDRLTYGSDASLARELRRFDQGKSKTPTRRAFAEWS